MPKASDKKDNRDVRHISDTWIEGWDTVITFGIVVVVVLFTLFVADPVGDFIYEHITQNELFVWLLSVGIYWVAIDVLIWAIKHFTEKGSDEK